MGPCHKCGGTERNKQGRCLPCTQAYQKAYYQAHKVPKSGPVVRAPVKERLRARYLRNKVQANTASKAWAAANPDKREEVNERSRLKKYGLTIEQHQALLEKQDGCCCICKEPFGRRVHIDHNHQTGVIRGLLCHSCNVGLGHFQDNPLRLREAASYLEAHQPTGLVVQPYRPVYRAGDGRCKATGERVVEIHPLRGQGLSLGVIAKKVGGCPDHGYRSS